MPMYGYISDQSRKFKASRHVYDYLKSHVDRKLWDKGTVWQGIQAGDGIPVPKRDRQKILNLKLHEEHLSPYFKTDMNLFHMLMLDDSAQVRIYKAPKGWLFVFDGIPTAPQPFGQLGYDTR